MDLLFSVIKLQIKLLTKRDRLLYFYIFSLVAFTTFKILSIDLLWQAFLTISNVYLVIMYGCDATLATFYKVLGIGDFKIHASKVIIIYFLSLLELIALSTFHPELSGPLPFISHFLSLYALLIFFSYPAWAKLLVFIAINVLVPVALATTPLYLSSISIFVMITLLLTYRINGNFSGRPTYSI